MINQTYYDDENKRDTTKYNNSGQYQRQFLKKPVFLITYAILFINVIVWLLMTVVGGSTNPIILIIFGAKVNELIVRGEYWRLISPIFLHIGLMHLFFNSYALYRLGPIVETLFGNTKFFIIYMISGVGGSIMSFIYTPNISAGASGAIFGLLGALLYFGTRERELFRRVFGNNLYIIIGVNLFLGFTVPNIDNFGHIGGLIFGFMAANSLGLINEKGIKAKKIFVLILTLLVMVVAFMYGLSLYS